MLLADDSVIGPGLGDTLPDEELDIPVGIADPILSALAVDHQVCPLREVIERKPARIPADRHGELMSL